MFLPTVSQPKQLLHLSFIDRVRLAELTQSRDDIVTLLADLKMGFRVLTDLGRLDSIEDNSETEIGKIMELCDQKGVGLVVRMIPDPTKDIGLNILTRFHYRNRPRIITCKSMVEAAQLLSL